MLFITIPSGVVSDLVTPQDFVSIVTTVEDKTSWGKVEVQNLCIQLTCIFFLVMFSGGIVLILQLPPEVHHCTSAVSGNCI